MELAKNILKEAINNFLIFKSRFYWIEQEKIYQDVLKNMKVEFEYDENNLDTLKISSNVLQLLWEYLDTLNSADIYIFIFNLKKSSEFTKNFRDRSIV